MEVSVTIYTCASGPHDVRADVEKAAPGNYDVEWCDKAALLDLCLTSGQLHYLRRRCEEAYDVIERERAARGIAGLVDDTEPMHSSDRDYRSMSDFALLARLRGEVTSRF